MYTFSKPVDVLDGRGHRYRVDNPVSALQILNDVMGEDPEKESARCACDAVLEGRTIPDTARLAFIVFALKRDILLEDTELAF